MKKIIAITTGLLMIMGVLSVSTANAGAARRHTIEGFMLGTGIALLGTAIFHGINRDGTPNPIYTRQHSNWDGASGDTQHRQYKKFKHHKKYARRNRGHWESERVWVEPVYEKKWNPGHYNRKGSWVSGRYERFVIEQGYWTKNRVWIWH